MKTKQLLLFLAFFLISFSSNAQSDKFSVGIDIYTNYTDRLVDHELYSNLEEPKFAVSFGAVVSYQINSKLAIECGLSLLNKGYQVKSNLHDFEELRWGLQHGGEGEYDPGPSRGVVFAQRTYKDNYYFIALPINAKFALVKNLDNDWYVRGGFAPAYYLFDERKIIIYEDEYKKETAQRGLTSIFRKFNLNLNFGFGYTFMKNEKYQISLEPGVDYMPFNLVNNAAWDSSFYSVGVTTRFMFL